LADGLEDSADVAQQFKWLGGVGDRLIAEDQVDRSITYGDVDAIKCAEVGVPRRRERTSAKPAMSTPTHWAAGACRRKKSIELPSPQAEVEDDEG